MASKQSKPQNPNPDYQDRDIKLKPLLVGLLILALVTVFAVVSMYGLLLLFRADADRDYEPKSAVAAGRDLPGGPLLQVVPSEELAAHREVERLFLEQYQWIDPEAGVARIPIDRAMAILAERGMPMREADDE
jgi:hypothetical protein